MAYENMDGALIDAAVAAGAKGLVIAGVGNGNLTQAAVAALAAQAEEGHRLRARLARRRSAVSIATSSSTTTSSGSWRRWTRTRRRRACCCGLPC